MKNLAEAFVVIFSDDDWFNKVLVGGFYIFFVLSGIGIVMVNGYNVLFMKELLNGNTLLPYWREFLKIFKTGWKVSAALILYYGVITVLLFLSGVPVVSLTIAIVYFILHTTLHPLVLLAYAQLPTFGTCFNPKRIFQPLRKAGKQICITLLLSAVLIFLSITTGWMAIIVGWPLLVFLSLLIQNAAITVAAQKNKFFPQRTATPTTFAS